MNISSDDQDSGSDAFPSEPSEDNEPVRPQQRGAGRLKSVPKPGKAQRSISNPSTQNGSSQKSPGKSKASNASTAKSKTAMKDQPKANGRPIYSFFNATTERLRTSRPSASPEKLSTPQEKPDIIHDESEDEQGSGLQLSKGSTIALTMRKRKVRHGDSFESETALPASSSQKFRKMSDGERVHSFSRHRRRHKAVDRALRTKRPD